MDVGKRIKYLRKTQDMNQDDLARKLHVAISTISNWENGRNQVSPDYYASLAKIFNISVSELLGEIRPRNDQIINLVSKPYLSYDYERNYLLWFIYFIVMILSLLSPVGGLTLQGFMVFSWILLLIYLIASYFRHYKTNIVTKYYKEDKKLFYEHQSSEKNIQFMRKYYLLMTVMLWFSINLSIIFSFVYLLNQTQDSVVVSLFSIFLILLNLLTINLFIIDYQEKYKSKLIDYKAINIHFFLFRNKLLLFVYTIFYIYYHMMINALNLNPYIDFGMLLLDIIMIFILIVIIILYESNKLFYSKYKLIVK